MLTKFCKWWLERKAKPTSRWLEPVHSANQPQTYDFIQTVERFGVSFMIMPASGGFSIIMKTYDELSGWKVQPHIATDHEDLTKVIATILLQHNLTK